MDAIGEYQKAKSTDLDMFFSEQNIARYRKLSNPETDESQRRTILRLLKKEFVKLRGSASRSRGKPLNTDAGRERSRNG